MIPSIPKTINNVDNLDLKKLTNCYLVLVLYSRTDGIYFTSLDSLEPRGVIVLVIGETGKRRPDSAVLEKPN